LKVKIVFKTSVVQAG